MAAESDVESMTDKAGSPEMEVRPYHKGRGECRGNDIYVSRPAGIVSARESNATGIASFQSREILRRSNGR